jgi:hypothetical protein
LAEDRLKIWETLFQHALKLIDAARESGAPLDDWSFGGGTVLMRRHHHRFSKDIDIFDLAMVMEKEPDALQAIGPVLHDRRDVVLNRIEMHDTAMRETFEALEILDYRRSYDECVALVREVLE